MSDSDVMSDSEAMSDAMYTPDASDASDCELTHQSSPPLALGAT